jgi:RND family efflux transporter MFP subunit
MSKDLKPKQRIGQRPASNVKKAVTWTVLLAAVSGGIYAAYYYGGTTEVDVQVAKARKADFVISVRTRGEIRSTNSRVLTAPQVPSPKIVRLAESGKPIKRGEVVVEFDTAQQEQFFLERSTTVRTADSEIVQTKASHKIVNENDAMQLMTAQFNLKRAELEASKAEILSEIEGKKNRINVGISEGQLTQVKTSINAHQVSQSVDLERLQSRKDKTVRDMERAKTYLEKMVIRAPLDGIVNILPNMRAQGNFGASPPPFTEGDAVSTGVAIAEIPDLSEMRVELKLEEVDRGKVQLGQRVRIRVDAIPDREFTAKLDWISPIASLNFRRGGMSEKTFPARATLENLDSRLRPGMSATAEVIIESEPGRLLIPIKASFMHNGKPAVYVQKGQKFLIRNIEVGKRNENDLIVASGLDEGEIVTLENPVEAAKRAKKL